MDQIDNISMGRHEKSSISIDGKLISTREFIKEEIKQSTVINVQEAGNILVEFINSQNPEFNVSLEGFLDLLRKSFKDEVPSFIVEQMKRACLARIEEVYGNISLKTIEPLNKRISHTKKVIKSLKKQREITIDTEYLYPENENKSTVQMIDTLIDRLEGQLDFFKFKKDVVKFGLYESMNPLIKYSAAKPNYQFDKIYRIVLIDIGTAIEINGQKPTKYKVIQILVQLLAAIPAPEGPDQSNQEYLTERLRKI